MEEKDFIDKMGVYDVVPRPAAAEKGCRVIRTRWVTVNKGSDDAPQLRARWVAQEFRGRYGDKHEYFTETLDLALVKAVIAHTARRAESEDIVVAVFDVRRAYFYEIPLSSCRTTCLPNSGQRMLGSCARRCTELAQLQHRGEMSLERGSSVAVSPLALCRVAASTMSCVPSLGRCMAMIFCRWFAAGYSENGSDTHEEMGESRSDDRIQAW